MALIPLTQTVTVVRGGPPDEYGNTTPGETFNYKCRCDEGSERTTNRHGEAVDAKASILIEGLVDIRYSDEVVFVNELGNEVRGVPLRIDPIRDFNPKRVLFTEVKI